MTTWDRDRLERLVGQLQALLCNEPHDPRLRRLFNRFCAATGSLARSAEHRPHPHAHSTFLAPAPSLPSSSLPRPQSAGAVPRTVDASAGHVSADPTQAPTPRWPVNRLEVVMPQCQRCVKAKISCIPLPNRAACANCKRLHKRCSLVGAEGVRPLPGHVVENGESLTDPESDEQGDIVTDDFATDYSNVDETLWPPAPTEDPSDALWAALRRFDLKLDAVAERLDDLFHYLTSPDKLRPRVRPGKRPAARDRSPLRVLNSRRKALPGHEQIPTDERIAEWRANDRREPSVEAEIPIAGPSNLERIASIERQLKAPAQDPAAAARLHKSLNNEDRDRPDAEEEEEDPDFGEEEAPDSVVPGSVEGEESFSPHDPKGKRRAW